MRTIYWVMLLATLMLLSGCGNDNSFNASGNCDVAKCMEMIDTDNSVSEINQILGIDGVLVDAEFNEYIWEISDDASIYVTYYDSNVGEIRAEYSDELIADQRVSFAKISEIESLINNGDSLDYQKLVGMLGNINGVLIEKNTDNLTYKWIDNDNRYLNATFSRNTGKCIMLTGMY